MSNRVTIFLNTAYDKPGRQADMQFRLSVLQARKQTRWGVCVFIFIRPRGNIFEGGGGEGCHHTQGKNLIY